MADFFRIGGELKKANPESSKKEKLAVGISLPLRPPFFSFYSCPRRKNTTFEFLEVNNLPSVVVDQWHVVVVVRAVIWVSLFTLLVHTHNIRSFGTRQCRGGGDDDAD